MPPLRLAEGCQRSTVLSRHIFSRGHGVRAAVNRLEDVRLENELCGDEAGCSIFGLDAALDCVGFVPRLRPNGGGASNFLGVSISEKTFRCKSIGFPRQEV